MICFSKNYQDASWMLPCNPSVRKLTFFFLFSRCTKGILSVLFIDTLFKFRLWWRNFPSPTLSVWSPWHSSNPSPTKSWIQEPPHSQSLQGSITWLSCDCTLHKITWSQFHWVTFDWAHKQQNDIWLDNYWYWPEMFAHVAFFNLTVCTATGCDWFVTNCFLRDNLYVSMALFIEWHLQYMNIYNIYFVLSRY